MLERVRRRGYPSMLLVEMEIGVTTMEVPKNLKVENTV